MTPLQFPRSPEALYAAFPTQALRPRHPGVCVREVRLRELRQVTNAHVYLEVDYAEPAGAPWRTRPSGAGGVCVQPAAGSRHRFSRIRCPKFSICRIHRPG